MAEEIPIWELSHVNQCQKGENLLGKKWKAKENQSKRWVLRVERNCKFFWPEQEKRNEQKAFGGGEREKLRFFFFWDKRKINGFNRSMKRYVLPSAAGSLFFILWFCQPKSCVAVTSAPYVCSCNLVCGSNPGTVQVLLWTCWSPSSASMGWAAFCQSALRKLQLTSQAASYCLDASSYMWFWMDLFCALVFLFDLYLIIVWINYSFFEVCAWKAQCS